MKAEQVQAIKDHISIVEVVSHFERLKKRGRFYWCKCPLHGEHSPSFVVTPAKGIFKCYGCGVGGDAIKFLQQHLKLDFMGEMKWLGDFYHLPLDESDQRIIIMPAIQQKQTFTISFISNELFKKSLVSYSENTFVKFLSGLFGTEITGQLIRRYFIGTSKHWSGATIFWQIDNTGKVKTGKIMLYNPNTGKRIKEPFNHIHWVHSLLKQAEFELKQCLFGEHLLKAEPMKPVAIVESEKTAIIASIYLPGFIWLAAGSKEGLNPEKCQVLQGRNVTLFPDLNGFEKWSSKAKELSHIARFTVSGLLEQKATEPERKQGLDLADYLIRFDYKQFSLKESFKREFLKPEPLELNKQQTTWKDYQSRGLNPLEAELVINELITEHGFIID